MRKTVTHQHHIPVNMQMQRAQLRPLPPATPDSHGEPRPHGPPLFVSSNLIFSVINKQVICPCHSSGRFLCCISHKSSSSSLFFIYVSIQESPPRFADVAHIISSTRVSLVETCHLWTKARQCWGTELHLRFNDVFYYTSRRWNGYEKQVWARYWVLGIK